MFVFQRCCCNDNYAFFQSECVIRTGCFHVPVVSQPAALLHIKDLLQLRICTELKVRISNWISKQLPYEGQRPESIFRSSFQRVCSSAPVMSCWSARCEECCLDHGKCTRSPCALLGRARSTSLLNPVPYLQRFTDNSYSNMVILKKLPII